MGSKEHDRLLRNFVKDITSIDNYKDLYDYEKSNNVPSSVIVLNKRLIYDSRSLSKGKLTKIVLVSREEAGAEEGNDTTDDSMDISKMSLMRRPKGFKCAVKYGHGLKPFSLSKAITQSYKYYPEGAFTEIILNQSYWIKKLNFLIKHNWTGDLKGRISDIIRKLMKFKFPYNLIFYFKSSKFEIIYLGKYRADNGKGE